MERVEKSVFISYRRTNFAWALAVWQNLAQHGYDVFIDYDGIASGDFENAIFENIPARAHFLIILTPSALERCGEPKDMMRREIETALKTKRNIVALMLEGFSFGTPAIANQLTGTLAPIKKYQALSVPNEFFLESMERLRTRFLNVPLTAVIHPPSASAKEAATEQKAAAEAAPPVQEEELTAQQYFERGVASSDPDERIRFNTEAIRLKPDYAEAYNNRGYGHNDKGDIDAALDDFNEAIRLRPDFFEAYNNRGSVRDDKGDLDGALADYNEAIRLKPDFAEAYNNRGNARKDKGDLEGSINDYNEAIRLRPDLEEAYSNLGVARRVKGDLDGALADYNEAIRLKPDYAKNYYNRGAIFRQQKKHAVAIADLQQYLNLGGGARDGDSEKVEQMIRRIKKML